MKLNILYLSHNMLFYKGANYQQDFINELKKNNNLYLYGPGFKHYKDKHNLEDIMSIFDRKPDIIFVGHSWLNDNPKKKLLIKNNIDLSTKKYFKIFFLNKEYVKLNQKLNFFNENNFNLGLSHHHEVDFYSNETRTQCNFIPFAFNKDLFENKNNNQVKKYDLGFSGIIQNQNHNSGQSDIRRRITKKLYHTFLDIPVLKKKKFNFILEYCTLF